MPDREVKTVKDLIFYQYAKIIAKRTFGIDDGTIVKRKHYGFIKETFRKLKLGIKSWSDITREDWQLVESKKRCLYCGSTDELTKEHIIRKSLRIKPECAKCDKIQGIHNQIWACKTCNCYKKQVKGLYNFYRLFLKGDTKFYDKIPPLIEKKYLKIIYYCHECAGTLNASDLDGDGKLTVLDIDWIVENYD